MDEAAAFTNGSNYSSGQKFAYAQDELGLNYAFRDIFESSLI